MSKKPSLIIIVGPTASGKTALSIKLAKKFNGEIVSADSRQVYRGMDIGTGKASKSEQRQVKHHLLDIVDPRHKYNVSHFQKDAVKAIKQIQKRGKLPFLVGGTAFWIDVVVYDLDLPSVKPNRTLRKRLTKLPPSKLYSMLKKIDPDRARMIDKNNPYRIIRAIEIVKSTGKPVPKITKKSPYDLAWLGITLPRTKLNKRIDKRLAARMQKGMVSEVIGLLKRGVPASRLLSIGLEYRYVTLYLQGKLTKQEMMAQLRAAIHQYAKRQMTWWKRNDQIHRIKSFAEAEKILRFRNIA